MPELPDIEAYLTALAPRVIGQPLQHIRLASPFLLRTAQHPLTEAEGRTIRELRRIGKRIALGMDNNIWLVLHLMIAGRLHWRPPQAKLAGRNTLAAFDFPSGSLILTEAGAKRRASLHVLRGEEELRSIDPGGIDVFASDLNAFRTALTVENRTLKRALTDPRILKRHRQPPIPTKSSTPPNSPPSRKRTSSSQKSGSVSIPPPNKPSNFGSIV